jgi:NAD(P)-dependent dehydrogenase (short-subunit alcohol dehydrogenase family)
MRLAGKAGVITGGSTGLGLATLRAMAAEGAQMIAFGRNQANGEAAVEQVRSEGGVALFHQGDVTNEQDIIDVIARCREEFGAFSIMHNNAGNQGPRMLHETTNEEWDEVVAVNLTAVMWGCKHAVLAMRETGGGSIINTASILSFTADQSATGYTATKTALLGLSKAIALSYIKDNIRCNCICPGDFQSPMLDAYFAAAPDPQEARDEMAAIQPGGRIADAAEIAGAAVFLASDESAFMNGTAIVVDGGMLAKVY